MKKSTLVPRFLVLICTLLLSNGVLHLYRDESMDAPPPLAHAQPSVAVATPEDEVDTLLVCILVSRRPNATYVDNITEAMRQQGTNIPGILVDLDDIHSTLELPLGFVRFVPPERTMEMCDLNERDIGRPNCRTRQQARDVALGLRRCSEATRAHTWVLFMEDDMQPCPNSMLLVQAWLSTLDPHAVRVAKFGFLPGVVAFPPPRSALSYVESVLSEINETPCDLMLDGSWRNGSTVFHPSGNLFTHIGTVSTNAYRNEKEYHDLYDDMRRQSCS